MNDSKKELLVGVTIALMVVGALVGGILFFEAQTKTLSERMKRTREEIAYQSTAIQENAQAQMQYDSQVESYMNILYNVVPEKDELIDLSKQIRSVVGTSATEYGFSFLSERQATESEFGAVEFGINIRGNTHSDILETIRRLQSFQFITQLDQFIISENEDSTISMTTKGKVMYR
jgi:hypothetical protein